MSDWDLIEETQLKTYRHQHRLRLWMMLLQKGWATLCLTELLYAPAAQFYSCRSDFLVAESCRCVPEPIVWQRPCYSNFHPPHQHWGAWRRSSPVPILSHPWMHWPTFSSCYFPDCSRSTSRWRT